MTLVDLVALVAGVALGFAVLASLTSLPFLLPAWVLGLIGLTRLMQGITVALSVVALGRVATYRRMPRSAEWLAVYGSATVLALRPEFNVDGRVNDLMATFPGLVRDTDFDTWRWVVAGLACLVILAWLAVLRLVRAIAPRWFKSLILAGLVVLTLAGPLWTFGFLGANLVSPSGGFGFGDPAILHREVCVLFAHFPLGVFFALPAVAALGERIAGIHWAWSEWAGAGASTAACCLIPMNFRAEIVPDFPIGPIGWLLVLAWLVAVFLTSRYILIHVAPIWWRWVEGPGVSGRSPPAADSPASTS